MWPASALGLAGLLSLHPEGLEAGSTSHVARAFTSFQTRNFRPFSLSVVDKAPKAEETLFTGRILEKMGRGRRAYGAGTSIKS